ncbi:E3 ubiquitin-protein ligase listerin, partial [Phenoliferia sp. Uapishka_3]
MMHPCSRYRPNQALNTLSSTHLPTLLSTPSSPTALAFLIGHLQHSTTSPSSRAAVWSSIFAPENSPSPEIVLKLISAKLPRGLPRAGIDENVLEAAQRVLGEEGGREEDLEIVKRLLAKPEPFISSPTPSVLLALVSTQLSTLVRHTLSLSEPTPQLDLLSPPMEILAHYIRRADDVEMEEIPIVAIFQVAHLIPNSRIALEEEIVEAAMESWDEIASVEAQDLVLEMLRGFVGDVDVQCSPIEIVNATVDLLASSPRSDSLDVILPTPSFISSLQSSLSLSRPASALSILFPLISQAADTDDAPTHVLLTDSAGLSSYARSVLTILEVSARDFSWVKKNVWVLPHVLLLADVARDELAIPGSTGGMFSATIESATLERLVQAADGLSAYLLSTFANSLEADWHSKAVAQLRSKVPLEEEGSLLGVMDRLSRKAREEEGVYERRALASCLASTLKYAEASTADAERWLAFAQGLAEGSPLACAIIYAIKDILAESQRFVRYQNELASTLAGVPSSAAQDRGLQLLQVLLATAPPLDAPIIFLPQQRSMFLIKQITSWIASDDEVGEQLYSGMAELFLHLAPIVQELSGGHWDLIFDIIESNLETASWDDNSSLPALYHSCRLLSMIDELAASNSELRATAKSRIDTSLELVRDLFVERPASGDRNAPRLVVLEIMAKLVRGLPVKLLKMGSSFDQLVKLLRDPSLAVQQSSYDLVDRIAAKYVSDLVVEVELETEESPIIELPAELIALLAGQLSPTILETPEDYSKASTFLLAWLTAFRFFDKGSPRIKAAYIDQLRRLDIVATTFLPSMFAMLGISDRGRAFDVTPWEIDDFRIDLVDEITETTLPVFAAFVYYRSLQAVPSLIRAWWEGCKNRQLSMAFSTFTSRHFSPVLIAHELAHLRDPNDPAGKALRDNEDFTVKVAAGANEVKAVFIIDEQTMEIGIRLPAEFPLQGVEVKDVKKVGVTDAQWRAWLLAVQQVITTQNGLIADALSLFKRNVTLHFDGVEPCAICYSIISVVDRSLPTKKCRTCNNLFHAGGSQHHMDPRVLCAEVFSRLSKRLKLEFRRVHILASKRSRYPRRFGPRLTPSSVRISYLLPHFDSLPLSLFKLTPSAQFSAMAIIDPAARPDFEKLAADGEHKILLSNASPGPDGRIHSHAGSIEFMELATGPPGELLLQQCGLLEHPATEGQLLVLDNACGGALITKMIFESVGSEKGKEEMKVICGDLSPGMIEVAKARIKENGWNAEAKVFDVLAIPSINDQFDYVLTNFQLQFLPKPELSILESHRVLKPGGKLGFTVWVKPGWVKPLQTVDPTIVIPPLLTTEWNQPSFLGMKLMELGFKDVQIEELDFTVPFESVKRFMHFLRSQMAFMLVNGNGERLETFLLDKYGDGAFAFDGWVALAVSGTVVKT